jgi:Protein of unknown function (DUF2939)
VKSRRYVILAALVAIAVAAYWYWSPFLTLYALKSAAQARDAEAFNARVDYPRLRESVKGQLGGYLMSQTRRSDRAGAALGALFGTLFADKLVDSLVRPEVMMRLMNEARIDAAPSPRGEPPSNAGADVGSPAPDRPTGKRKLDWVTERSTLDRIVVYVGAPDKTPDGRVGAVLDRSGFATWKLTEIRLPSGFSGR